MTTNPYWALGNCFTELKKPRKAEQSFRQAIALCTNADKTALLFNLANVLFDQKRYASAIALYSQTPSNHPLSRKTKRNAYLEEN
jgi:tetratricopeptide (TPR) repeat protein